MYRQKAKLNGSQLTGSERPLGCWQVTGIALVVLVVFLLIYEPLINLVR